MSKNLCRELQAQVLSWVPVETMASTWDGLAMLREDASMPEV